MPMAGRSLAMRRISGNSSLDGRTLNLAAGQTATLQGPTYFYLSNGATLHNAGTFLAQNDYVIGHNGGAAGDLQQQPAPLPATPGPGPSPLPAT